MFRCLSVCLPEVTHSKRHNMIKSKKLEVRSRGGRSPLFHYLSEVTDTQKRHNRLKSKKLEERERGGWPPLFRCLSEATHSKRHNMFKSKKTKRERVVGGLHCSTVCLNV